MRVTADPDDPNNVPGVVVTLNGAVVDQAISVADEEAGYVVIIRRPPGIFDVGVLNPPIKEALYGEVRIVLPE